MAPAISELAEDDPKLWKAWEWFSQSDLSQAEIFKLFLLDLPSKMEEKFFDGKVGDFACEFDRVAAGRAK
jgi:hypothetical protein